MSNELEELRKEADDLGVKYSPNLGAEKLKQRIEDFYEGKETSGPALEAKVEEKEKQKEKSVEKAAEPKVDPATQKRIERERNARKTRIVTIVDNDQRVNNHTTTCTVNCSNEFFDLGTMILPLNEKIEVAQGHLKTLEQVKIPLHVRDTKTGLANVRLRPRYTISYEDNNS